MMTLSDLKNQLEATGIPVVYRSWPEKYAPPLPYVCYYVVSSDNFAGDGSVYYPITSIRIELYTAIKDQNIESKLEKALDSFFWDKDETYIENEKMYGIIYDLEV